MIIAFLSICVFHRYNYCKRVYIYEAMRPYTIFIVVVSAFSLCSILFVPHSKITLFLNVKINHNLIGLSRCDFQSFLDKVFYLLHRTIQKQFIFRYIIFGAKDENKKCEYIEHRNGPLTSLVRIQGKKKIGFEPKFMSSITTSSWRGAVVTRD